MLSESQNNVGELDRMGSNIIVPIYRWSLCRQSLQVLRRQSVLAKMMKICAYYRQGFFRMLGGGSLACNYNKVILASKQGSKLAHRSTSLGHCSYADIYGYGELPSKCCASLQTIEVAPWMTWWGSSAADGDRRCSWQPLYLQDSAI